MRNKKEILDYAAERGIGQVGTSAKVVGEILDGVDDLGQDGFKEKALEAIIDAQERKRKGRNPRRTGEFQKRSDNRGNYVGKKQYRNPRTYLTAIEEELDFRVQQEEAFLREFVEDNNELSEEGKAFLRRHIAAVLGPWVVSGHVRSVREENGRIIVKHNSGEGYYYPNR